MSFLRELMKNWMKVLAAGLDEFENSLPTVKSLFKGEKVNKSYNPYHSCKNEVQLYDEVNIFICG